MEERSSQAIRQNMLNIKLAQRPIINNPLVWAYLNRNSIVIAASLYFDCYDQVSLDDKATINLMKQIVQIDDNHPQVLEYYRLEAAINREKQALKIARDREFLEDVKTCDHIFYTGLCDGNHIRTTCLKCGINSDIKNFINLSEYYFHQLEPIIISLFFHGNKIKYPSVSDIFSSLTEAEDYYYMLTEKDPLLPSEQVVERMLQIKKY